MPGDPSTGTTAQFFGYKSGKFVELLCLGLALGLQGTTTLLLGFWTIVIPACVCESIEIGHTLSKMRFSRPDLSKAVLLVSVILTPVGIFLGSYLRTSSSYTKAASISFCAGYFVFMCACMLINKEFKEGHKNS